MYQALFQFKCAIFSTVIDRHVWNTQLKYFGECCFRESPKGSLWFDFSVPLLKDLSEEQMYKIVDVVEEVHIFYLMLSNIK